MGAVRSLPDMYRTAGAKLTFDAGLIGELVQLVEDQIEQIRRNSRRRRGPNDPVARGRRRPQFQPRGPGQPKLRHPATVASRPPGDSSPS